MSEIDWKKDKTSALINAATHAINRSRYVFIVSNIAGIVALSGILNATTPWLRNAIARIKADPASKTDSFLIEHLKHLQKIQIEDLSLLNIPLVGTKVQVYDLNVFASSALLVIAIWQYYCIRRESQIIFNVKTEAERNSADKEYVSYLYHGVAHYFVFTTNFLVDPHTNSTRPAGADFLIKILFYMPAWIPFLIVFSDVSSIFIKFLTQPGTSPLSNVLTVPEIIEITIRDLYATILGVCSFIYCSKCHDYDSHTRKYIDDIKGILSQHNY